MFKNSVAYLIKSKAKEKSYLNGKIENTVKGTLFNLLNKSLLTVCKSRRNSIKVIKPDKITKGIRLDRANSFPNLFPIKQNTLVSKYVIK